MESSAARRGQLVDLSIWRKDTTVVRQLRQLLAEAEAGRVIGIIGAAHCSDQETIYIGGGSMCDSPMLGVAAISVLKNKLLA